MAPMKAPESVTLEGRSVRLEPLDARHMAGLMAAGGEWPDVFRYVPGHPLAVGWESWMAEALAGVATGRYVAWATVLRGGASGGADGSADRVVGSTRFGDIEPGHGRVEIGWTWLARSAQRTAANTEAKYLQLRYAFEELGAGRVAFKTDARNEQAQRALERIGAVREGVLRAHIRLPDGYVRDSVYYSILAREWPAVKARLEARLEERP
jgi:RimJ/RimL family protein N-acetyltransferase